MADIRIARDLALPVDVVTQAIAILARKGAGKTYTASVIVEEVVRAKVPVVILDPTGAWWGLRTSAAGDRPGLPVVIFGGDHGDVPLEPTAGAVIADVVIEHPGAYVIDLSAFPSKRSEQTFAADLLERLYRAKKAETGPLLLVIDEADMFAPQRPGPEQTRTLGALESIVRRGRIKGLGDLLITQRAAVLNKNVLTQTEVLVVMQTTGPQDIAAVKEWVTGHGTKEEAEEFARSLPPMERGEAWIWSPSFLRIMQRVRIRERTTFDSSRTPTAGEARITPTTFAKVDLEQLGTRIAATIERAKADDPRELRRRIAELERAAAVQPAVQTVEKIIEVPVLNGEVEHLMAVAVTLQHVGQEIAATGASIVAAIEQVTAAPRGAPSMPTPSRGGKETSSALPGASRPQAEQRRPAEAVGHTSAVSAPSDGEPKLDAGARRMLSALAALHPRPLTRIQLGTLTDLPAKGSTFRTYLSQIRAAGLLEEIGVGAGTANLNLSAAGVDRMQDELGAALPSTAELVEMWGRKLDRGARQMLGVLVDVHPAGLSRDELADVVEIPAKGSTFRTYLSKLRSNQLIEEAGGRIRASEALFLGGRR